MKSLESESVGFEKGEDALREVIGEVKTAINCIYKTNKMQNVQYVGC